MKQFGSWCICLSLLSLPTCAVAQQSPGAGPASVPASSDAAPKPASSSRPRLPVVVSAGPDLPATMPAETSEPSVEAILGQLQERGKDLADFSAAIRMNEIDNATGLETVRMGHITFQRRSPGDDRIRVTFESEKVADGDRILRKLEYLLQDGKMWDRDYSKKSETVREVVRPGEKIDLLKLGEGPFPLPIGQDPAEVHRQFEVSVEPAADDLPQAAHVVLIPKAETNLVKKMSRIDVMVDPETHFPIRIVTTDPQQTKTQTIDLTQVKINNHLDDKAFELPSIEGQGWSRHDEVYQQ